MPIKVIKYTCQFRCHKSAESKLNNIERHEKNCRKNPENRTCNTCKHEKYFKNSEDGTVWYERGCRFVKLDDFIQDVQSDIETICPVNHVPPLWNCPCHNQSVESNDVDQFIEKVRQSIQISRDRNKQFHL